MCHHNYYDHMLISIIIGSPSWMRFISDIIIDFIVNIHSDSSTYIHINWKEVQSKRERGERECEYHPLFYPIFRFGSMKLWIYKHESERRANHTKMCYNKDRLQNIYIRQTHTHTHTAHRHSMHFTSSLQKTHCTHTK